MASFAPPANNSGSSSVSRNSTFRKFVEMTITAVNPEKAPAFYRGVDLFGNYKNCIELSGKLGSQTQRVYAMIQSPFDLSAEETVINPDWKAGERETDPEKYVKSVERAQSSIYNFLTTLGVDASSFTINDLVGKTVTVALGSSFYSQLTTAGLLVKGMDKEKQRAIEKKFRSYTSLLTVANYGNNPIVTDVASLDSKTFKNGWPRVGAATMDILAAYIPADKLDSIKGKVPLDTRQMPGFSRWADQLANENWNLEGATSSDSTNDSSSSTSDDTDNAW
jgi:hypothetical protein